MSVPKGTKIHVNFIGTVEDEVSYENRSTQLVKSDDSGSFHFIYVRSPEFGDGSDVTIIQEAHKHWPPQKGDIWKLSYTGVLYYVYEPEDRSGLRLMADGLESCSYPVGPDLEVDQTEWILLFRNGQPVDNG